MSKILIIEDEIAIADLEKDYLELSGFDVEIETAGDTGLLRALQQDFDLIILSNSGYGNARGELSEMVYDAFFETNDTIQKKFEMDTGYI